eukprot:4973093-Amphidinium_carterae.1
MSSTGSRLTNIPINLRVLLPWRELSGCGHWGAPLRSQMVRQASLFDRTTRFEREPSQTTVQSGDPQCDAPVPKRVLFKAHHVTSSQTLSTGYRRQHHHLVIIRVQEGNTS